MGDRIRRYRNWKLLSTIKQNRPGNILLDQVSGILAESLQVSTSSRIWNAETPLLGNLPELDSMAVLTVITELEAVYGIVIEDDDDLAGAFETLGSLVHFIQQKMLTAPNCYKAEPGY